MNRIDVFENFGQIRECITDFGNEADGHEANANDVRAATEFASFLEHQGIAPSALGVALSDGIITFTCICPKSRDFVIRVALVDGLLDVNLKGFHSNGDYYIDNLDNKTILSSIMGEISSQAPDWNKISNLVQTLELPRPEADSLHYTA